MYNPRLQTPFPRAPLKTDHIVMPALTPPEMLSPVANTTHSLFTPIKSSTEHGMQSNIVKSYTLPRVRSRSERDKSSHVDKEFGDAKEYILALPEPLRLKPQTDGDQPVAFSTLDRLPDSDQLSSSADKHLHPNRLFEQIRGRDPRDSSCSSTSMKVREPASTLSQLGVSNTFRDIKHPDQSRVGAKQNDANHHSDPVQPYSMAEGFELGPYNASVAAMHRLRTYRSLIGAPPPEPLSRAGTLTRPKTPVLKLRHMYDRTATENKATSNTVSRNDTVSTQVQTVAGSSDRQSSQSSASSAPKQESGEFAASALSLLPTPLQIRHSDRQRATSASEKRDSRFTEELEEVEETMSQPVTVTQKESQEVNINVTRKTVTASTIPSRCRPPPLTLNSNIRIPIHQTSPIYTKSPAGKRLPHHRLIVGSLQASSVYSRDTQGLSLAQTPVTPVFSSHNAHHYPLSPTLASTIGTATGSDKGTEVHLIQARGSPTSSAAKQKVEDWDVDMGTLHFDTSPSLSLKRALSNLGSEMKSTHEASTIDGNGREDHRRSTISTEMDPSEARLSSVVGAVRISTCIDFARPRETSYTAPGGADWL